jgi:hypothetical protein
MPIQLLVIRSVADVHDGDEIDAHVLLAGARPIANDGGFESGRRAVLAPDLEKLGRRRTARRLSVQFGQTGRMRAKERKATNSDQAASAKS